jgi:hypothetical protein
MEKLGSIVTERMHVPHEKAGGKEDGGFFVIKFVLAGVGR